MAIVSIGTNIKIKHLVYPYFLRSGARKLEEIKSFPGVFRYSLDQLLGDIARIRNLGLNKILLFGIPDKKDCHGTGAYKKDNLVAQAVKGIKKKFPDLVVMTDVCLCAYTSHGHCGLLKKNPGIIEPDLTLQALAQIALSHADAGADWVAPSAMAKKQVQAIRKALDEHGFKKTKILGYSAKFASNFYGPFRNAADSAPKFGDRRGYQLDFRDGKRALQEIKEDIAEGADMVMVKPALSYLDVIKQASLKFKKPLVAYNVSGEYAFVKYGVRQGLWKEKDMVTEILASIRRAGADLIITYHAKDVAQWLKKED